MYKGVSMVRLQAMTVSELLSAENAQGPFVAILETAAHRALTSVGCFHNTLNPKCHVYG